MKFDEKETSYGNAVEVRAEMPTTVPCVERYRQGDVFDVRLAPDRFDDDECTGCDFYEVCKSINDIKSILDEHKL